MVRSLTSLALLAMTALAWCGCSTPPRDDPFAQRAGPPGSSEYAAAPASATPPQAVGNAVTPHPAPAAPINGPSESEAAALAATVAQFGNLDPQTEAQLVADLRQTDPRLWPQLLDSFRAAMQFQATSPTAPTSENRPPMESAPRVPAGALAGRYPTTASQPSMHDSGSDSGSGAPGDHRPGQDAGTISPATASALANLRRAPADGATDGSHAPITLASFERQSPAWQAEVTDVIRRLEADHRSPEQPNQDIAREVYLRLMYLAAGRRDDALRRIPGISPQQQEFWADQLYAIGTWLDSDRLAMDQRRAEEALVHFDNARGHLAAIAALHVANLHFCRSVDSYGIFEPFEAYEFRPNQEVILYAEIDHFMSQYEADKGYYTAIQGHYEIIDSRGQRASEHKLQLMKEHCHNPRRDYFVAYRLQLPDWIYDGEYTLQLTVEDTLARKIGQSKIEFTVKR